MSARPTDHAKCRDSVMVGVWIAADLSGTGEQRFDRKPIDRCIAPIVSALSTGGVLMRASCCGHGERDGSILLQDGRELLVRADPRCSQGKHDFQAEVWACSRCGQSEPKSSTGYVRTPSGWDFSIHVAPEHDEEVLRHEFAHVLTRFRFGEEVEIHGDEFESALKELA